MKKFDLVINGIELLWEDADGDQYGGFDPASIEISVDKEDIDMDNVYFENVGYVDFDENVKDGYADADIQYNSEIEFTEEEEEESQHYWDEPSEHEGENQTLSYIEASICVRYGEARFNGVPTGINIVKGIYFNDKIIEL